MVFKAFFPYSEMLLSQADRLLEPGYLPLETGYHRLSDSQFLVAAMTRMPGCSGEMVNWWFGYLDDSLKYKMWCPKDHLKLECENRRHPGEYIGSSHLIRHRIGKSTNDSRVYYHHPSDFFSTFDPLNADGETIICANIYDLEKVLESRIIHYIRDTDYGCEMRSRIWLMHATDDVAIAIMHHCLDEMGNLADTLPDLYSQELEARR